MWWVLVVFLVLVEDGELEVESVVVGIFLVS